MRRIHGTRDPGSTAGVISLPSRRWLLAAAALLAPGLAVAGDGRLAVLAEDRSPMAVEVGGQGPFTLIFVHGWMCDRSFWSGQLDAFSTDFEVVALDLPGHGASPSSRSSWTIEGLAGDVVRVAEATGEKPVILIGHSMGGPVCLEAAQRLGDRCKGIVGVDTLKRPGAPRRPIAEQDRMAAMVAADFAGFARSQARSYFHPSANPALVEATIEKMAAGRAEVGVPLVQALDAYDAATGLRAQGDRPVSLINAAARGTDAAAIRAACPQARVLLMRDVGHFLMMERPINFNAVLRAELMGMTGALERA